MSDSDKVMDAVGRLRDVGTQTNEEFIADLTTVLNFVYASRGSFCQRCGGVLITAEDPLCSCIRLEA